MVFQVVVAAPELSTDIRLHTDSRRSILRGTLPAFPCSRSKFDGVSDRRTNRRGAGRRRHTDDVTDAEAAVRKYGSRFSRRELFRSVSRVDSLLPRVRSNLSDFYLLDAAVLVNSRHPA